MNSSVATVVDSCWTLSIAWSVFIYKTFREMALLTSSGGYHYTAG